jgi:proline iminopeptidase
LFDQRGAGRSTPAGETRSNTTADLVSDIERIRQHLCIQQWILFGGSWGSALALAYAQEYPERVLTLVLRGLFLGSAQEIHWFNEIGGGASFIFPERWRAYESYIPTAERGSLVEAYWRRLNHEDAAVRDAAGLAWRGWADGCITLRHDPHAKITLAPEVARAQALIELHYLRHMCFLQPRQLISGLDRLRHIPAWLIQGRYDMVCPMKFAHEFAKAWPELQMQTVTCGHSAFDPAISDALVKVMDTLVDHLLSNDPSQTG